MLLATALALLIKDVKQQVIAISSKQTGSSSTKRKPSPIISSFLNSGRMKTVDELNCGGAENVSKQNPANIRKMDRFRFYY